MIGKRLFIIKQISFCEQTLLSFVYRRNCRVMKKQIEIHKIDTTPTVVDSTENNLDPDIGDWKPGSHVEVDLEEKEE
jgi:hypothetical protein